MGRLEKGLAMLNTAGIKSQPKMSSALPTEIWMQIVNYLDAESVLLVCQVSKLLSIIGSDSKIWRHFCYAKNLTLATPMIVPVAIQDGDDDLAPDFWDEKPDFDDWKEIYIKYMKDLVNQRMYSQLSKNSYQEEIRENASRVALFIQNHMSESMSLQPQTCSVCTHEMQASLTTTQGVQASLISTSPRSHSSSAPSLLSLRLKFGKIATSHHVDSQISSLITPWLTKTTVWSNIQTLSPQSVSPAQSSYSNHHSLTPDCRFSNDRMNSMALILEDQYISGISQNSRSSPLAIPFSPAKKRDTTVAGIW